MTEYYYTLSGSHLKSIHEVLAMCVESLNCPQTEYYILNEMETIAEILTYTRPNDFEQLKLKCKKLEAHNHKLLEAIAKNHALQTNPIIMNEENYEKFNSRDKTQKTKEKIYSKGKAILNKCCRFLSWRT